MKLKARHLLASVTGFTIAEMAVVLTVTTVAAGAVAPSVQDYISETRYQHAIRDTRAIAVAVSRFEGDVRDQSILGAGIRPDPWGHRYVINISALSSGASRTVVVSAGPNGQIETAFHGETIFAGGDDLIAVVAPARPK